MCVTFILIGCSSNTSYTYTFDKPMSLKNTVQLVNDLAFDRGYLQAKNGKEIQANDQSSTSRFYKPGVNGGPPSFLKVNTVKLTPYEYRFDIDYDGIPLYAQDIKYLNWEIQAKIEQINA